MARLPDPPGTLVVPAREWSTPLTGVTGQHGNARLRQTTYARGLYPMEGIDGFEYVRVRGPGRMPVTTLQRREYVTGSRNVTPRWNTWMVDDPLHWYGMRQRVMALPPGRLLVAGLGLGLFAHHLLERPDITSVEVVEIDPDVIALVAPTLPDHPDLTIVEADFYMHLRRFQRDGWPMPDAVLWDLAVGGPDDTRADFYRSLAEVTFNLPGVHLSQFGLRGNKQTILG